MAHLAHRFVESIYAGLQPHAAGTTLLVALSGGPDSVALARAAAQLHAEGLIGRIVLAHFNHQLRGAASDSDELFVRELHKQLTCREGSEVLFCCGRQDVLSSARENKANLEATARRLRYQWLADIARAEGAEVVLTGHTADDQAETVLHHIMRGTGLCGLRGIARCRPLRPPTRLVRPMLGLSRQQVLTYLASMGQPYCVDATNHDLRQTRARIRHELVPSLQAANNGQVVRILCRLAEEAARHYERCVSLGRKLASAAELPQAGLLYVFDRRRLAEAPGPVLREALRLIWRRASWPERAMTVSHWNRLADVVVGRRPAALFPGGIAARVRGDVAQIGPETRTRLTLPPERYAWTIEPSSAR
jgi:tRNA(Ile)-lysidine synthase